MDFSDVLKRRRMVRNYTDQLVEDDVLGRIAAAALRAPSAGNSQAIGVVVVTSGMQYDGRSLNWSTKLDM